MIHKIQIFKEYTENHQGIAVKNILVRYSKVSLEIKKFAIKFPINGPSDKIKRLKGDSGNRNKFQLKTFHIGTRKSTKTLKKHKKNRRESASLVHRILPIDF